MWLDYVDNPLAITHLYKDVPPLENMEVLSMMVHREGPIIVFDMNLPRFADNHPAKWSASCNTVNIEIEFRTVSKLSMQGFSRNPIFGFAIQKSENEMFVQAGDRDCQLSFYCENIYLKKVSGYTKMQPG